MLTEIEKEIWDCYDEGLTASQISHALEISLRAVKEVLYGSRYF